MADRQVRTLCMTLAYAGCRLSEALALTADRVDLAAGADDREAEEASHRDFPQRACAPCPAGDARHGARHTRAAGQPRQRARCAPLALEPDDRMARRACHHGGGRARWGAGVTQGAAARAGWPPSPRGSRSTSSRNGSGTPSSPRPPSTPMPLAPRKRTSLGACGGKPTNSGLSMPHF